MPYSPTEVTAFFRAKLAQHGDSPAALEWSHPGQLVRFDACCRTLPPSAYTSVLDLGCGLGHFADVLAPGVIYTGVDACAEMIAMAHARHPTHTFRCQDILTPMTDTADLVIANGVLNLTMPDNRASMEALLRTAYRACRRAAVVTMLSIHADHRTTDRYYYNPAEMLTLALRITPNVILDHAYLPHDFAIRFYRDGGR